MRETENFWRAKRLKKCRVNARPRTPNAVRTTIVTSRRLAHAYIYRSSSITIVTLSRLGGR